MRACVRAACVCVCVEREREREREEAVPGKDEDSVKNSRRFGIELAIENQEGKINDTRRTKPSHLVVIEKR